MSVELASGDVHCWSLSLEAPPESVSGLYATLADGERERCGRLRFERDRRRFVVARGALRDVLARYVGTSPDQIRFVYNPFGRPELGPEFSAAPRLRFNLSHSAERAVIAVAADHDVGVDLEYVRDAAWGDIVRYLFTAAEVDQLNAAPRHLQTQTFFRCWTKREAYGKARGEGLTDGPVEVGGRWSFFTFQPAPDYIATLAVGGDGWRLTQQHWQPTGLTERQHNLSDIAPLVNVPMSGGRLADGKGAIDPRMQ